MKTTHRKKEIRQARVRAKARGTSKKPRLSVFSSNKFIYAQIIDDEKGETLADVSSAKVSGGSVMEKAREVGKKIAEEAKKKNVEKVVFDRGASLYTGKVKEVADGAREGGLLF